MAQNPVVNSETTIYGDRLELYFNDKPLAFGKSCSLEITSETLDTSNKMSGDWKEFLVGKLSFTLSTDALLTYSDAASLADVSKFGDLLSTMVKRYPVTFKMAKEADGDIAAKTFVSGKVVITQLSVQADDGQLATCSISLQGTGELKVGDDFKGTEIPEASAEA